MLFVRQDIPWRIVSTENFPTDAFFVEINPRNKKWLLRCSHNPNIENTENHFETLSKSSTSYSPSYENLVIVRDFKVWEKVFCMPGFCDVFVLKSLIKDAACYKNP